MFDDAYHCESHHLSGSEQPSTCPQVGIRYDKADQGSTYSISVNGSWLNFRKNDVLGVQAMRFLMTLHNVFDMGCEDILCAAAVLAENMMLCLKLQESPFYSDWCRFRENEDLNYVPSPRIAEQDKSIELGNSLTSGAFIFDFDFVCASDLDFKARRDALLQSPLIESRVTVYMYVKHIFSQSSNILGAHDVLFSLATKFGVENRIIYF
jgi:hypothetical protein